MSMDPSWKPLLEHLGRGSQFGYYWQVSGKKKRTTWYPTCRIPNPPADREGSLYFGIHGTGKIPRRIHPETGKPRDPRGIRALVADVCAVNCLFAEFDAKDFGGNRVLALAAVERIALPPSMIIDSGGGFHCYWLLNQPQLVSAENRVELARLQGRWVDFTGGDPASKDLARVLRVPGTLNRKYSPPRPVTVVRGSAQMLYELAELEACLPPQAVAPLAVAPLAVEEFAQGLDNPVVIHTGTPQETVDYWTDRARAEVGKQGSQNSAALWLACQLRDAGMDAAQVETGVWQFLSGLPELRAGEPWTGDDAERITRSTFSRPARRPASGPAERTPGERTPEPEFEPLEDWIAEMGTAADELAEPDETTQSAEEGGSHADADGDVRRGNPRRQGGADRQADRERLAPALPADVRPDAELAATTGHWLEIYTNYAAKISPMTPRSFHQTAALFMVSVVIARRIKVNPGHGDIYPNLFVAWLAPTTLYKKTTALNIVRGILMRDYPHLLTPQGFTTESFISELAGYEPPNLDSLSREEQERWHKERNYAAQRGLVLDEFSGLLAEAGKDYNGGLIEAILRFSDCDPCFVRITRSQGRVTVSNAYLSFLGATTPAAVARQLRQPHLWDNGWWPRFILATPEQRQPWKVSEPATEPEEIGGALKRLYNRLPPAQWPGEPPVIEATIAPEALQAFNDYFRACNDDLITDELNPLLWAAYGRLPAHALKTGLILAALDWPDGLDAPRIEAQHMARALLLAEEWRESAHRAIEQSNVSESSRLAGRVLRIISTSGRDGVSFRDIYKAMRDKNPAEIAVQLEQMMRAQQIEKFVKKPEGGGRSSECYRILA